jgi:hypothetical protein
MFHVIHVAIDHLGERHGGLAADGAWMGECRLRDVLYDVQQVTIEQKPQVHEIGPRFAPIMLDGHPGFLLIAEPSQLGISDEGMCFVFNKGTPKVSTTF